MNRTIAASILGVEDKKTLIDNLIKKGINWIHYDLMDGIFVENTSLSIAEISTLVSQANSHIVDIHLMTKNPYEYCQKLHHLADYISFHLEAISKEEIARILDDFKGKTKLGIAINPQTKISEILPFIDKLDYVLIMSVVAGKGGQQFMPETLEKVAEIKQKAPHIWVQMDGGINGENTEIVFQSGVKVAVSGSYLIKNLDNDEVISRLLKG